MNSNSYSENEIIYLSVKKILPNPYQPRRDYNRKKLEELAESIKKYGILQPVIVRYINNKIYELVTGERRLKATKLAGLETIPAVVVYANDRESAAIAIAENLQREGLNYIEEAECIRILSEGFEYNNEEISHIINKNIDYIEETETFLGLGYDIKTRLTEKKISRVQALEILKLNDESLQRNIIERAAEYKLNDNAVAELVESTIRQQKIENSTELNHLKLRSKFKDIRLFNNTIKQAVALMREAGMETSYEVSKNHEDYEIRIYVRP